MNLDSQTPSFVPQAPKVRVSGAAGDHTGGHVPSTTASWSLLLAHAIERCGVNAHSVFADAGIDLDLAQNPETRFPVECMSNAWKIAVERTQDSCLPLRLTQHFQPQNVSAIGVSMSLSVTAMDALKRCVQYSRIATEGAVLALRDDEGSLVILCVDVPDAYRAITSNFSIEAFMAILVELLRQMNGQNFSPQRLEFTFARSAGIDEFIRFFNCPVCFEQPRTQMFFDRKSLQQPRGMALDSLARVLDIWMADYLIKLDENSLVDQLRTYLLERMAQGHVELPEAARYLGASERSLQRRLAEDGLSFTKIKDDCRRLLAERLVLEGRMALAEIAFVLGFADQSAFTRCFRRWTSMSPKRFAHEQAGG